MIPPSSVHRLAVVLSHPTQYYSPWFRWLVAHNDLDLRVFYLWEFGVTARADPQFRTTVKWDVDLLSGYPHEFVPNTSDDPGSDHFNGLRNPALTARLAVFRPTAVLLFGYAYRSHLHVIFWARLHRIPLLFRGDSHFIGRGQPGLRTRLALRALYAQFAAFLTVGAANRDYFLALGVPASRMHFAPHSVDAALFDSAAASHHAAAVTLRTQLGLAAASRVILFAGKFVPAKQPRELLAAFLTLRPADTALVFVGDGEEKAALHALAATAPAGTVHFLPFANQSEMPARYLLADLFVLPSRGLYETWGLAVNEAMHLGVPALVSDRVGCQRDLVTDGDTGWVFPAEDSAALAAALGGALAALADPAARANLRAAVASRIARYTYAQTTNGLLSALASLPDRRPNSLSLDK
jgi:glycosyltransferase involved in cell wall biosynthesis